MAQAKFQRNNLIARYNKTIKKWQVRPVGTLVLLENFTYYYDAEAWMNRTKDYVKKK